MSYCRWNASSDVYCFSNGDTWTTHVRNGQSYHDSNLAEFKARLLELRALGYRVPDDALDRVERELAGVFD